MADTAEKEKTAGETVEQLPTDRLREQVQLLLAVLAERMLNRAAGRVEGLTERLADYAEHGGPGMRAALSGGRALAEGKSPMRAALTAGMSQLKDKVKGVLSRGGGGGGGGKKVKVTNIVEHIDVGLPLQTTYNLWSQFQDFPNFMKKVVSVEQESDEKTNWKAKIFWSTRTWQATIVEQVPDSHIVWRSNGAKGHVDGTVSFTELGPNLTRILVVLEYHPQGLFEKTGNLWRAQGRRARLELKHFRRHAMTKAILDQDEIEGWRGEIRDSQVVRTHEDAVGRERDEDTDREPEDSYEEEYADDEPAYEDEAEADDDRYADEEPYEAEAEADEEPYDETDEADETDRAREDDEYADEEPAMAGQQRRHES
jgi:uncharacterized membrane protein